MAATLAALASGAGVLALPSSASAVANVCVARTPTRTGTVTWQLRQVSGLTTVAASPGVLFTHNDRGIRDSPAAGEDTTAAAVWAVGPDGVPLARFRLVDAALAPIPYFDTEAIARDPQGRIVLADTGTNVDARVTVALYRFTPPVVVPGQAFVEQDVTAEVIPLAYYANATTSTKTKLNVESMAIDAGGAAWFVPRQSGKPYSYVIPAAELDQAAGTLNPARAVRSSRLTVAGPMTDAAISPDGTMLLVKTGTVVYAYNLSGHDRGGGPGLRAVHRGQGTEEEGPRLGRGDRGTRRRRVRDDRRGHQDPAQRAGHRGLVVRRLIGLRASVLN